MTVQITMSEQAKIYGFPKYETEGSAGLDIRAISNNIILPGERKLVFTGLKIAVPVGFECQIRPRSGLAFKHGITVLNSPGTIDSDYRGEIGVILFNASQEPFEINAGDRIAQMVFAPVVQAGFEEKEALNETDRSIGGFGSTGK